MAGKKKKWKRPFRNCGTIFKNVQDWNPRKEERENGKEEIFKEVSAENFPKII